MFKGKNANKWKSKRLRDVALENAGRLSRRTDWMVIGAAVGLVLCLMMLVFFSKGLPGEIVMAITTGMSILAICLKDAYNFEFGSSRGSKEKDDTIASLIKNRKEQLMNLTYTEHLGLIALATTRLAHGRRYGKPTRPFKRYRNQGNNGGNACLTLVNKVGASWRIRRASLLAVANRSADASDLRICGIAPNNGNHG